MVIKVYVNSRILNSSAEQTIPKTLDGYEIEIEEIGDVKSLHGNKRFTKDMEERNSVREDEIKVY